MFRHLSAIVALIAALPAGSARGADADVTIRAAEAPSAVFGGTESVVEFAVTARRPFEGRAGWTIAYKRRTLARGERVFAVDGGLEKTLSIRVAAPPVRPGVIAPLTLSVALTAGDRTAASYEKRLWVFPRDPFADKGKWLAGLDIRLFDPEGTTAKVLEKMKVPFALTANPESLLAMDRGLIVIAEGLSFDDYRGLPEVMARAAARGRPVLCLAPSAGDLPLPPGAAGLPAPKAIVLRRRDAIADLDERLGEAPVASSVTLTADRRVVAARVAPNGDGWPWLELRYPTGRGRLLLCGCAIIRGWDAGPVPRFLFVRLLERLGGADIRDTEGGGDR